MYIIETYKGLVHIDTDELAMLKAEQSKPLIFFRQGAVNPKQIVRVYEDKDRKKEVLKLAGESDADHQARIDANRSDDIFELIRTESPAQLQKPITELLNE